MARDDWAGVDAYIGAHLLPEDAVLDGVRQLGAKTQVAVVEQVLAGLLRRTDLWGKQTEEVLNDGLRMVPDVVGEHLDPAGLWRGCPDDNAVVVGRLPLLDDVGEEAGRPGKYGSQ